MSIKNIIVKTAIVATTAALVVPSFAGAVTVAELQAQINALLAQLSLLQGSSAGKPAECAGITFVRNLAVGATGSDVSCLQAMMKAKGHLAVSPTGYFGQLTLAAVRAFQAANGIVAANQAGPLTRAKLNAELSASVPTPTPTPGTPTPTPSGPLSGGAGSITVAGLSTYAGEEVGEDEEDVKVLAFEVEADSDSDVAVTSVKVELFQQTAADSGDLDDYAKEISVWMGSTEVGRADEDEFSDSGTTDLWVKNITLKNAVVKRGTTNKFYLAVSANPSLDSGDIDTDDWQIGVSSVRFTDATGVSTTETITLDIDDDAVDEEVEQRFNFASFATATDIELKFSKAPDAVNDAHTIDIDDTEDTDDVVVLAFNLVAQGNSDVTLNALPVEFTMTATTATDLDDVFQGMHLWLDDEEVGTADVADCATDADCVDVGLTEDFVFDDLDLTLEAGKVYKFKVSVDLPGLDSDMDAGDTILATIDETQTDQGEMDAEDESGEQLVDADMTGTAVSEASDLRDVAFTFKKKSTSQSITFAADPATAGSADTGTYVIKFEVTAFDGDVSIDRSCEEADADAADQGIEYTPTNAASSDTTCSVSSTADDNPDDSGASWVVREGATEEFTLTVAVTASADHFAKVYLDSINWDDLTTDTSPDIFSTSGLGEDDTSTGELYLQFI